MSFITGFIKVALDIDVDKGEQEVTEKSEEELEKDTGKTWAARALGAYRKAGKEKGEKRFFFLNRGDDLRHEALEHSALSMDYGKQVGRLQRMFERARAQVKNVCT